MDMIQTDKLVFEYDKRDEDGNIIGFRILLVAHAHVFGVLHISDR